MQSSHPDLRVDGARLLRRIEALAEIGPIEGGGSNRLALTDADKEGRDLVVTWMRDLGLEVGIDEIGNVVATRAGREDLPAVMTGSHIDTVRTGGRYDGNLGVLAGLEVIEVLERAGVVTRRPLAVAFFTNEEGSRFQPDMMGSLTYVGGLPLEEALSVAAIDGPSVGDELMRIGYAGPLPCPGSPPAAFVELHIEQGPVLEVEDITIGAVESVQGISWQELTIVGQSNHAGTTPMSMRHDAGFAAAEVVAYVRRLAAEMGGHQVATVGRLDLHPDLVNVVPGRAVLTVDLRNTDDALLTARRGGAGVVLRRARGVGGRDDHPPLPRPLRAGRVRRGDRGARGGHGQALGTLRPADALGRRPRRADARPRLPRGDGVHARAEAASATTRPSTRTRRTSRPAPTCCCRCC